MTLKHSRGFSQNGTIVGNTFPKYQSKNPVVRVLMRQFEKALEELVCLANPETIHEVGCGEGYWVLFWKKKGKDIRGSDFSSRVIDLAQLNAQEAGISPELFSITPLNDLRPEKDSAECVMCLEVLEHLEDPQTALDTLSRLQCKSFIFSVPNEPLWRFLNLCRGKYWKEWGNTPGHLQHWSKKEFIDLLSSFFITEKVLSPTPWTVVLARPRLKG